MVEVTGSKPVAGTNSMKALGRLLMPLAFTRDCSFLFHAAHSALYYGPASILEQPRMG